MLVGSRRDITTFYRFYGHMRRRRHKRKMKNHSKYPLRAVIVRKLFAKYLNKMLRASRK
jgi:hypothetical protein